MGILEKIKEIEFEVRACQAAGCAPSCCCAAADIQCRSCLLHPSRCAQMSRTQKNKATE